MEFSTGITDVLLAARFLKGKIYHTPTEYSFGLSERFGTDVFCKWENRQMCGSFKIRGALYKMFALSEEERSCGVVTSSSGNHAQGVATAAAMLGVKAVICVPSVTPETKRRAIRARGEGWAELRIAGAMYDEAEAEATRLSREEGMTYVSAFEDHHIISGQGTLGLEMLTDEPELDLLLCPASGGGLISGVAIAATALRPGISIVGVHAEANPSWTEAWKAGHAVPVEEQETLAEALCGYLPESTFALAKRYISGVAAVSEEEIAEAMRYAHTEHHQVVEGGGAVALAALLAGKVDPGGRRVGVVVSGGNADDEELVPLVAR